jgi:hypothetical protein
MSTPTAELLRQLLPRYFWLRDAEAGGGVLAAVVDAIADQYDQLSAALDRLYDDVFLVTCDPRYVPLIADEIGVAGLAPDAGPGVGDRAWVGGVIGLRRRKGMLVTLARGATAATGWASYVQEGRPVLSASRSMLWAGGGRLVDLAGRQPARRLLEPWSEVARGASIAGRPVLAGVPASSGGSAAPGYRTPASVALSVWRLQSYPVSGRTPRPALDAPPECAGRAFRFDPLGRDTQLFATATGVEDRLGAPQLSELPLPLTVELLEQALARAERGGQPPIGATGCERFAAADLPGWRAGAEAAGADAVVDPVRGRLLLRREPRERLTVDYAYGFPGQLGGGPYGTADDYAAVDRRAVRVQLGGAADPGTELRRALRAGAARSTSIVIDDSATYRGPFELVVEGGAELRLASAPEAAPVLEGDLEVRIERGGRLELSGLTIAGALRAGGEGDLVIEHCALAAGGSRAERRDSAQPSLAVGESVAALLSYAIVHGLEAGRDGQVTLRSSVLDGPLVSDGTVELACVTALDGVRTRRLIAADCLFRDVVAATDGLIQTSYLPAGSFPPGSLPPGARGPQQLECLGPEVGLPRFVSTRWGDAAYCQLHLRGPRPIATGASHGGELGVYNWLGQPERFARLPIVLQELMPAGVGASIQYLT